MGLRGSLLIAHPSLLDPNFRKTVIFISSHTPEDGAFGLTLNRPTERTVADLLPDRDLGPLMRLPVFLGGPVAVDQLVFASFLWHPETGRIECRHHLDLDEAQDKLDAEHVTVRAFVGYSGWGKGQLEGELAQHAWLVGNPGRSMLDSSRSHLLWKESLSAFGPWFRLVAEAPDDLSSN